MSSRSAHDASEAELVFLAVSYPAYRNVAKLRADWNGWIVVGATNFLDHPEEKASRVASSKIVARHSSSHT